jgi:hypothetical protein
MAICVSQLEKSTTPKKKISFTRERRFSSSHFHPKCKRQINGREIPDAKVSNEGISLRLIAILFFIQIHINLCLHVNLIA